MSDANGIPSGQQRAGLNWGDYPQVAFVVQQALAKMQTATLVRIESCTNSGGVSPVGLVDVTPLVNQVDGQGNPTPHVTIYNIPYFRLQGGANAIIIDPVKGDIGVCVFASRDISKIKATKAQGNPGSQRQYSFSDGMYMGGMLNGAPTQYVQFSAAGIKVHSPVAVILEAPDIQLNAATVEINGTSSTTITTPIFTVNGQTQINGATSIAGSLSQTGGSAATLSGSLAVTGDVTAQGTSVHTHTHGGVTTGTGSTGAPL